MGVTLIPSGLVPSSSERKRRWGFWIFHLSNALWAIWGFVDEAYALIVLQVCLAALNIRGVAKNDRF